MLLKIAQISESPGTLLNIEIPGLHITSKKLRLPDEGAWESEGSVFAALDSVVKWIPGCKILQYFGKDGSLVAQRDRIHLLMQEAWVQSLSCTDPLEEEMATHSSILAWEIPWTEEPGRLLSMGSQKSQTQLINETTTMKVNVAQLCLTLHDSMDNTVHGILQARILEWVTFYFSRGSSQRSLAKPGLPYCRQILYQLSYKGRTTIKYMFKIPKNLLLQETLRVEGQEFIFSSLGTLTTCLGRSRLLVTQYTNQMLLLDLGASCSPPPFRDSRTPTPFLRASRCPSYWKKLGYKQSQAIWVQTSQFGPHFQIFWAVLRNHQWI